MTDDKKLVRKRRYPKDVLARMGYEIYENKVRPIVEEGNKGKLVAIDIESGDYKVDTDTRRASQYLIDKNLDAQIWCVRIGYQAVHRIPVRDKVNSN